MDLNEIPRRIVRDEEETPLLESVTITGDTIVGEELSIAELQPEASDIQYQWQKFYSGNGAAWTDIAGANSSTLVLTESEVLYSIRLIVSEPESPSNSVISNELGPVLTISSVAFTEGNSLQNVEITIFEDSERTQQIGDTLTTDSTGEVSIDLVEGTYWYSASIVGYYDSVGSFIVSSSDSLIEFTMNLTTEPIFYEDFEGTFITIPDNWTNLVLSGTGWIKGSESNESFVYHIYSLDYHDAWLITPKIDLPNVDEINLSFRQSGSYSSWYEYHGIWISTTDTDRDSFVEILELGSAPNYSWEEKTIDISSYKGESVYIAFVYQGEYADRWNIDDVEIK
ncbi:choice-of-anchor J domain-containing protein [Gudongella sp. DL1XJH-153]|uniref:choice-of-anchor J domain-containing protein n=1 Tax=Gudongella sp. DL1XJH-153 TaxID=3409804 RepID=UPI003BB4F57B